MTIKLYHSKRRGETVPDNDRALSYYIKRERYGNCIICSSIYGQLIRSYDMDKLRTNSDLNYIKEYSGDNICNYINDNNNYKNTHLRRKNHEKQEKGI